MKANNLLLSILFLGLMSCALPAGLTPQQQQDCAHIEVFNTGTPPKVILEKVGSFESFVEYEVPLWAQICAIPTFGLTSWLTGKIPTIHEAQQRLKHKVFLSGGNAVINYENVVITGMRPQEAVISSTGTGVILDK